MTQINIKISEALHKALKIRAIEEGINMQKAVNVAIERYIEEGADKAEVAEG